MMLVLLQMRSSKRPTRRAFAWRSSRPCSRPSRIRPRRAAFFSRRTSPPPTPGSPLLQSNALPYVVPCNRTHYLLSCSQATAAGLGSATAATNPAGAPGPPAGGAEPVTYEDEALKAEEAIDDLTKDQRTVFVSQLVMKADEKGVKDFFEKVVNQHPHHARARRGRRRHRRQRRRRRGQQRRRGPVRGPRGRLRDEQPLGPTEPLKSLKLPLLGVLCFILAKPVTLEGLNVFKPLVIDV